MLVPGITNRRCTRGDTMTLWCRDVLAPRRHDVKVARSLNPSIIRASRVGVARICFNGTLRRKMTAKRSTSDERRHIASSVESDKEGASEKPSSRKELKAVPVRLSHTQWFEAREFALRENKSLQDLFVEGLNEIRRLRGYPPLTGT